MSTATITPDAAPVAAAIAYPSRSRDGRTWIVELEHGRIRCGCEGYRYRRRCWHAQDARRRLLEGTAS